MTWGSVTTAAAVFVRPRWRSEPGDNAGWGAGYLDVGWASSLVRPRWGSRAGRVLVYERVGLLLVWPRRGSWTRARVVREGFGNKWLGVHEFVPTGSVAVLVVAIDRGFESGGVLTLFPDRVRTSFVFLYLPVCSCSC
jgi:hypothetical protein